MNPDLLSEKQVLKWQYICFRATHFHDSGIMSNGKQNMLRLPHTSRFFVVEMQIFCRGEIGLKFVGK